MKYVRWYDKDPDLSKLMAFIQTLNDEIREEIAADLIQIVMNEVGTNHDDEISILSASKVTEYKRWYDTNLSLHSAIEIIKNLDENIRVEIVSLIMESIVQILAEHNYDGK